MSTIVTRSGKGSPLTHTEVDDNFTNLNTDKYQEGSAIGAVTPAAGTFTTLTATGQTSLGGAAGSESLRVTPVASAVNWLEIAGATSGSATPTFTATGTNSNISIRYQAKGTGVHRFDTAGTVRQFQISDTASAVNYVQVTGAATTKATVVSSAGSDSNISSVFQSKGTGAIDLAAGSSGVNISNGGTVTAITRTAAGSGYTTLTTPVITAPTTSGGVQATATCSMYSVAAPTINSGGTGYTVGDVLTLSGGVYTSQSTFTVTSVSAGVITGLSSTTTGNYTTLPSNPASVTGGTGTGATITPSYGVNGFTITNAGSGYVEQPTVSFSGGGGSGAAAYATVGSGTTVKSLGSTMSFNVPATELLRLTDVGSQTTAYWNIFQGSNAPVLRGVGTSQLVFESASAVPLLFRTNSGAEQFRVAHTASAVNYVQVTGAATGGVPAISMQGSDANITMRLQYKGNGGIQLSNAAGWAGLSVVTANNPNYFSITGNASGTAPVFAAVGGDTNIDLTLTPKGTGNVRFGTYTASVLAPTGYIEIKDSGGTTRRLLVG